MKKFIYSALILGSAVALASCSADEPGAAKGDGNVTLTVQLPADAATRYGEGTSVTTLYYTVYAAGAAVGDDGTLPESLASGSVVWPAGQTQAQVELTLVPGDLYDVVFFADNEAAEKSGAYTYDASTAAFSIDYSKIASNSDDYDAFFTKYPNLSTATTEVIPLSRPFAQLNIGTNDWDLGVVKNHLANGGTYSSTLTFKTKGLASGVNFFSGDYTDATTAPEINITKIALGDGYPVEGCKYLEMNYLLVDPAKDAPTLTEATYTVTAGTNTVNKLDLTNLPLRANYQTNVYGALLSTKATFKVEIQYGFATTPYNKNVSPQKVTVTTTEELLNALKEGGYITIPENTEIELPATIPADASSSHYGNTINEPTELIVNGTLKAAVDLSEKPDFNLKNFTHFYVNNDMKISGSGTLEAGDAQSLCYVGMNGNLEIEDVTINFTGMPGSPNPYCIRNDGITNIENAVINIDSSAVGANNGAILSRGKAANLTVTDTEITITGCSTITEGINCQSDGTLTNVNITSDGRCFSADSNPDPFDVTLVNCVMYAAGDRVLYVEGDRQGLSKFTIDGGKYSCKVTKNNGYSSPILLDNNQGYNNFECNILGGEFVTQPWGFRTRINNVVTEDDPSVYLGEGCEWQAIDPPTSNPVYAWRVVKK